MNKKILLTVTGVALAVLLGTCELEVRDPVRLIPIMEPYISKQPQSQSINYNTWRSAPTLTVAVTGWDDRDGEISYQWYTFENMAAYTAEVRRQLALDPPPPAGTLIHGGTKIDGATGTSLLTEVTRTPVGQFYYYYVIVTNDYPDSTTETRAQIQSEPAILSVYNNAGTSAPVITKHPVGGTYIMGRDGPIAPLEVLATVTAHPNTGVPEGTLSYQWFRSDTFSATGGTAIDGAIKSSFIPEPGILKMYANYFYVEVTNTDGDKTPVTVTPIPVSITMEPGVKAAEPRITLQPRSETTFTGTVKKLSVDAVTNDGGDLTFTWYKPDKPADTVNEAIGADRQVIEVVLGEPLANPGDPTGKTFTPPTPADGTEAYYCAVVTNTNEYVVGDKTAVKRSNIVTVRRTTAGTLTPNTTINLKDPTQFANLFQFVRGHGGMEVAWANFPETFPYDTHMMYNPDWGLGFNILRIMIVPPGSSQPAYTNHADIILGRPGAEKGWSGLVQRHRKHYIDNVKIVNDYGGYVLASPWTPPKEWKSNNSINSGGHLLPSKYKAFANYLRDFCQFMYSQGAPVYAVSIANEPNYSGGYDGCEWKDNPKGGEPMMMNFFVEVGQFTRGARGYGGGKAMPRVLIMNGESANNPDINKPVLDNPISRAAVDLYARHVYGEQRETLWKNPYATYKDVGAPLQTECWMTEHNINSANATAFPNDWTWNYIWRFMNDVDLVLRLNNENAFVWWANKRFYSFIGDGDANTVKSVVLPRGYGLSHFAKYTNETIRFDFNITGNVATSDNGSYTIPIQNIPTSVVNQTTFGKTPSSVDFDMDGLSAKVTAYMKREGREIKEITMVMYTPTKTDGTGGYSLGNIEINMPTGLVIDSASGHLSTSSASFQSYDKDIRISSNHKSAYVRLDRSQILSLRFIVSPDPDTK
jgi:O-glycosyl hydrolase